MLRNSARSPETIRASACDPVRSCTWVRLKSLANVRFSARNAGAVTSTVADLSVLPVEPELLSKTITVLRGSA